MEVVVVVVMCVCVCARACACMCVCERERETERGGEREREPERDIQTQTDNDAEKEKIQNLYQLRLKQNIASPGCIQNYNIKGKQIVINTVKQSFFSLPCAQAGNDAD